MRKCYYCRGDCTIHAGLHRPDVTCPVCWGEGYVRIPEIHTPAEKVS